MERGRDLDRLRLTAPVAGIVLPPPTRPRQPPTDDVLPAWSGSPLEDNNRGAHLAESDVFCRIGDPHDLEVVLVIDQSDVELVREGQTVKIKLDAYTGKTFVSAIEEVAKVELKSSPPGLSNQAGGDLATRTDASGRQQPLSTSYQASAPLDNPDQLLHMGLRGRG